MTNTNGHDKQHALLRNFIMTVRTLFNLKADTDEAGTIKIVQDNVDFRSANAWTLVFAILIASIGLNVNSTAVIIGAMLISPLMGPIVGAGLALGINDYSLLRRALKNLAYAIIISVLTSAVYFLISPLSDVQSELLSRTRPSFFDVLIAIFGGAAGFVALSRSERGNAIPGVAIATALMPPLCTAGFGLARGEPKYFLGALYLFVINSVFICISTYALVRYMRFRKVTHLEANQKVADRWVATIALIVVVPSLILAWILQQENSFRTRANDFISRELRFPHSFVINKEITFEWNKRAIIVDMLGESLSNDQLSLIREKLKRYLISPDVFEIRQSSIEENLEKRIREKMNTDHDQSAELKVQLTQLEMELKKAKMDRELSDKLTLEAGSVLPKIRGVILAGSNTKDEAAEPNIVVIWKTPPSKAERTQIQNFLQLRLDKVGLKTIHSREI